MSRRVALAASISCCVVACAAPFAFGHTFAVVGDERMGSFRVRGDGTLRGALRAFGRPDALRRRFGGTACRATWTRHGLTIDLYNLGGGDACSADGGRFSRAVARGDHWTTGRRLRVGDSVARLRRLHPTATFRRGERGFWPAGWWLVRRTSPFGSGGSYPGLLAETRAGRVVALHVRYPAGGD